MKTYLRENPTIAFGLGLPLLLVVVFLLISGIPRLLVDSPQYDVIYTTENNYYNDNALEISVVNQKAQVTYQGNSNARNNNQKPRLWRYNPKTGAVKEIAILLPSNTSQTENGSNNSKNVFKTINVSVPDLEKLTIDSSSIAPDGYEFYAEADRYSRNFFGGLFYSSRYRSQASLIKKGRSIRLPNPNNRSYRNDTRFIGWVISQ